jgi:tetratricopeptide (TPR) repeat protein
MNPYKILGVRPNASHDEIKAAYDNLVNTYSSQDYENFSDEFLVEDKLAEINDAYNALNNEKKYKEIRGLIESEQFINAETELNLIADKNSPEWNYLKGFVMLKKGWFQSGVNHLKTAAELNPSNIEYKETLLHLSRKINEMKRNYARAVTSNNNANNMNPCGGSSNNNMCGNPTGGSADMSAIMNMLSGMNGVNGNNSSGIPTGNPIPQNNPLQNMLLQNLMSQGGNGMNMCGNPGGGGKMC